MHSLIKHAAVNASGYTQEEARAILAELEPVNPNVLEARKIVLAECPSWAGSEWDNRVKRGDEDCNDRMRVALVALSRGRALERGE